MYTCVILRVHTKVCVCLHAYVLKCVHCLFIRKTLFANQGLFEGWECVCHAQGQSLAYCGLHLLELYHLCPGAPHDTRGWAPGWLPFPAIDVWAVSKQTFMRPVSLHFNIHISTLGKALSLGVFRNTRVLMLSEHLAHACNKSLPAVVAIYHFTS